MDFVQGNRLRRISKMKEVKMTEAMTNVAKAIASKFPKEEYPNWYGSSRAKYVPHGMYSDAELIIDDEYLLNEHIISDPAYDEWLDIKENWQEYYNDIDKCPYESFEDFMNNEADQMVQMFFDEWIGIDKYEYVTSLNRHIISDYDMYKDSTDVINATNENRLVVTYDTNGSPQYALVLRARGVYNGKNKKFIKAIETAQFEDWICSDIPEALSGEPLEWNDVMELQLEKWIY